MYSYAQWLDRLVHENMIDSQRGKPCWKSTHGSCRFYEFAHISHAAYFTRRLQQSARFATISHT